MAYKKKPVQKYQKVIKVGNSIALTLDKDFVQASNIKAGDIVAIVASDQNTIMTIAKTDNLPKSAVEKVEEIRRQRKVKVLSQIPPEFMQWVEDTLDDDVYVFRYLANL